jgi:hypothetical protein
MEELMKSIHFKGETLKGLVVLLVLVVVFSLGCVTQDSKSTATDLSQKFLYSQLNATYGTYDSINNITGITTIVKLSGKSANIALKDVGVMLYDAYNGSTITMETNNSGFAGRECYLFHIKSVPVNETYNSIDLCLDAEYGFPHYRAESKISGDNSSAVGSYFMISFSINANASVVPQNATQNVTTPTTTAQNQTSQQNQTQQQTNQSQTQNQTTETSAKTALISTTTGYEYYFDPCTKFSSASMVWRSFMLPISSLQKGTNNVTITDKLSDSSKNNLIVGYQSVNLMAYIEYYINGAKTKMKIVNIDGDYDTATLSDSNGIASFEFYVSTVDGISGITFYLLGQNDKC